MLASKARKVLFYSLIYQIYPVGIVVGLLAVNPDTKTAAILGAVAIAQIVLFVGVFNWIQVQKNEIKDEYEELIRLKVNSFTSKIVEVALASTIIVHLLFYRDMPTLLALIFIGIPGILAQVIGNYYFRKE